jgi:hypothetical protein
MDRHTVRETRELVGGRVRRKEEARDEREKGREHPMKCNPWRRKLVLRWPVQGI